MTSAPALLALEDGTVFAGRACGVAGETSGEVVFNTSLSGYQEIITNPAYAGQILTMTMPHIGNCGANGADMESRTVFAAGLVVRELSDIASNWRSEETLAAFLVRHGVVAIEGVDTRKLTRHIREAGSLRGVISTTDLDPASLAAKAAGLRDAQSPDLITEVAVREPYRWGSEGPEGLPVDTGVLFAEPRYRVVAVDTGITYSLLRRVAEAGCDITVVPPRTSADDILALAPDGVFLGSGPGEPRRLEYLVETVSALLGRVPLFGVGLGHQILALAVGGATYELDRGHRTSNQPVCDLVAGTVEITSQHHGHCVDFGSIGPLLPEESAGMDHPTDDLAAWVAERIAPVVRSKRFGRVRLTHVNLNDMTVEGLQLLDSPALCVQYHPVSPPQTRGSRDVFDVFTELMGGGVG